jgi:hypothetical protein
MKVSYSTMYSVGVITLGENQENSPMMEVRSRDFASHVEPRCSFRETLAGHVIVLKHSSTQLGLYNPLAFLFTER